ncbi:hypothetical protein [Streptomyces sp. NPDC090022]|uniref:hypothetical protein n=1 Tax=Streptomyces sp. NPDC090022 TaxID=3365920 RepID=UPI003813AADC
MQSLPVPELEHTRTRPLHWLATATAMAAVIAAAGLLQPDPAAGTATTTTAAPGTPAPPAAPDTTGLTYPLDCRGVAQNVTATTTGDLDGDGHPETVVAVQCAAGSGTPPHALYVVADAARPRVVATLLAPAARRNVTELAVRDQAVTATLLGYSAPEVPRCCPDTEQLAKWRWTDGKFSQELTGPNARSI